MEHFSYKVECDVHILRYFNQQLTWLDIWNQWNGMLEWNAGMEHWNGMVEWNNKIGVPKQCSQ